MKLAEHYVENSSEIDLSKCTFIPEAPRIKPSGRAGHSEAVTDASDSDRPSKLVSSPKKSKPKATRGKK